MEVAGLLDELRLADPKLPRLVYWNGRLRPLPQSLSSAASGDWLSTSGTFRFFAFF